MKAMRTVFHVG